MDKRVIFAVAGSGKTTHILNQLTLDKKSLIITYTNNNIKNLKSGIIKKFGLFPDNITLLPYFTFLYSFCFRPLLSYNIKTKGINYKPNLNRFANQNKPEYYIDNNRRLYSNRISKLIEMCNEIPNVKARLEKYFDNLYIDEIQDFGGNDFNFLKHLTSSNINILVVGDFHQHTFDTSRDGNVNRTIHNEVDNYISLFDKMGLTIDIETLDKSWRCSPNVCEFISNNLGIDIKSHKQEETTVALIEDQKQALKIFNDDDIVKLFYQEHYKYNCFSRNWGDSKGENHYQDICVVLNKTTFDKIDDLSTLKAMTKNKLYVACSRANRNLFLVSYKLLKEMKN